jgi:hypothetical protein
MRSKVKDSGFRVETLSSRLQGLELKVFDLECRV